MKEEEFNILYEKHRYGIHHFCLNFLGNELFAEEATQMTFLKLHLKFHQYDPTQSKISTWLFTIARNECLQLLRKEDKYVRHDMIKRNEGTELWIASPHRKFVGKDSNYHPAFKTWFNREHSEDTKKVPVVHERVCALVEELDETRKHMLMETVYKSSSYEELADEFHMNINTVKSKINQAKRIVLKGYKEKYEGLNVKAINRKARDLAEELGRDWGTIRARMAEGWSEQRIRNKYGTATV